MTLGSPPSFFKILLDPSVPHMPLPSTFVSKFLENKVPKNPVLQSSNGGFSWKLKIKEIDGNYCFSDGWINVIKDMKLGFGDFLVFQLVDPSTFNVLIFSPNGCEKNLYSKIKVECDNDILHEEEEEVVHEEEDVDHENDVDNNDEDEDEDDEYEEEGGGGDEHDEEQEDYGDDEEEGNYDPFFTTVLSKSHRNVLRLPAEFARLVGMDGERRITMKNADEKEWQMRLRQEKMRQSSRYYLNSGWTKFCRANELSEGDKCVFKFIRSEDKLCLAKVTKKKPAAAARDPPTEAVKRKRGPGEDGGCGVVVKRPRRQEPRVVYF